MVLALISLAVTAIEERLVYQPNLSDIRIPATDAVDELWEAIKIDPADDNSVYFLQIRDVCFG